LFDVHAQISQPANNLGAHPVNGARPSRAWLLFGVNDSREKLADAPPVAPGTVFFGYLKQVIKLVRGGLAI
jgi:hypothetical protein